MKYLAPFAFVLHMMLTSQVEAVRRVVHDHDRQAYATSEDDSAVVAASEQSDAVFTSHDSNALDSDSEESVLPGARIGIGGRMGGRIFFPRRRRTFFRYPRRRRYINHHHHHDHHQTNVNVVNIHNVHNVNNVRNVQNTHNGGGKGANTAPDPQCTGGQTDTKKELCCPKKCSTCGGAGCHDSPGSASECCRSKITAAKISCTSHGPPCLLDATSQQPNTPAPPPSSSNDPTCANGKKDSKGVLCCSPSCTSCGSDGCGAGGMSSECCRGPITAAAKSCSTHAAPCLLTGLPDTPQATPLPTPMSTPTPEVPKADPSCANGKKDSSASKNELCCSSHCNTCGGDGCGSAPGSAAECCRSKIKAAGLSCATNLAPCILGPQLTPEPTSEPTPRPTPAPTPTPETPSSLGDPTCSRGMPDASASKNELCCSTQCASCGGSGCGAGGLANQCCRSKIKSAGKMCSDNEAPCLLKA